MSAVEVSDAGFDPMEYDDDGYPLGPDGDGAPVRPARRESWEHREAREQLEAVDAAYERFTPISAADLVQRAKDAPPRQWLVKRLFAEDHYGVMAAGTKSLKTWVAGALAVCVATGDKWLGRWEIGRTGPVLMFWGEGGWRAASRRMQAVARHYGHDFADLPIHVVDQVPTLLNDCHMAAIRRHLDELRPTLVIVDPAFLAVLGVNLAAAEQVYEALNRLRLLCDEIGAALLFVHHNKKTGEGTGHAQMSGAGFAAWGRSLISITSTAIDPAFDGESAKQLQFEAVGGEAADVTWHTCVRVSAVDPDDLDSDMRYHDEPVDSETAASTSSKTSLKGPNRCLSALDGLATWSTVAEVQEFDADHLPLPDSLPMKMETVKKALARLAVDGKCQKESSKAGDAARYAAMSLSQVPAGGVAAPVDGLPAHEPEGESPF